MKTREDSFFGIHFDFHAQEGQTVGTDFRPEVVAELLDRVKPDYVQCDTKGHYGYSSYQTKIGTPPTTMAHDVLRMWRQLTKERDIALYAHHSGLFDAELPMAIQKQVGKGSITFMALDFAAAYEKNVSTSIKRFLSDVVLATGYVPLVQVSGSAYADLTVMEKDGKLQVNIVNTAGPGGLIHVRSYNEVPKIGPLTVRVRKENIAKVTRMPESMELEVQYKDGCAEFILDSVHIHTTAVIEFQ